MASNKLNLVAVTFCLVAVILACSTQIPSDSVPIPTPKPSQTTQAPAVSIRPSPTDTPARAVVSALQSVNVRQAASERSASLEVLYKGDFVRLTGRCSGPWAEIRFASGLAWINGRYLAGDRCKEE